jgi:hypothetical protein
MQSRTIHLHSMLVHPVVALLPLAAVAFVLRATGARVLGMGTEVWSFLLVASLALALLVALPAALSGVLERRHLYVTWFRTHTVKLSLSIMLVAIVAVELALVAGAAPASLLSPLGLLVVVANPALALALGAFGLKMTLGRQSLGRTSYRPDLFAEPPVDVLAANADFLAAPPDLVDVLGEALP